MSVYPHDLKVNTAVLHFGAWSNLLYLGLLCLGWWFIAGFIPPYSPTESAEFWASMYQTNTFRLRLGMVLCMFGAAMYMVLGITSTYLISRAEGFFRSGLDTGSLRLHRCGCFDLLSTHVVAHWAVPA